MTDFDWQQEQERLAWVLGEVRERLEKLRLEFSDVHQEVVQARRQFWRDITNKDDILDTILEVSQQSMVLSEGERRYNRDADTIRALERLERSPYFGRVDFLEQGMQVPDQIYIGTASFRGGTGDDFLVYDWRAPIASVYYDYGLGEASYSAPGGEYHGSVELKRQYVIRDGTVQMMFDTGVTIGDDLLMQALSQHGSAEMRGIVATIQTEQNRIIRDDTHRLLVVHGVAGSGKTSAALQRVAYLLYRHRQSLEADQMILFSPNRMFNSYVATVLPDLGEYNMQQTTFQEYLDHRLGREFQIEDAFEQLEYVLAASTEPGYAARLEGIRFKSSHAYLDVLSLYAQRLEEEGMRFVPMRFDGREVVSAEQMEEKFREFAPGVRVTARVSLLRDWLLVEISRFGKRERTADWVDEEMNYLDADAYHRATAEAGRRSGSGNESDSDLLAERIIHKRLRSLRSWVHRFAFVDLKAIYAQLFRDERLLGELDASRVPRSWPAICRDTLSHLSRSRMPYEDATPYLYLSELIRGARVNLRIRHAIIDEAQDYSPFQLEFLRRLFPQARMTVLGDRSQAILAHGSVLEDIGVMHLFPPQETEIVRLDRSYRSTREIVEFTRAMLADGDSIIPFDRHGQKPQVLEVDSEEERIRTILEDLRTLMAEGNRTLAVICRTAEESRSVHRSLRERLPIELIGKETATFPMGPVVVPAYLAKGVEFDAVLIHDASRATYRGADERNLFYTACTRAMHVLHLYCRGPLTPLLDSADPSTYEVATR